MREKWIEFLQSSAGYGRFLSPLTSMASPLGGPALDITQVETFLGKLRGGPEEALLLVDAIDLLSGGYLTFVLALRKQLLSTASFFRTSRLETTRGGARGGLRLAETYVRRMTHRLLKPDVVVQTSAKSYDTFENQLVRLLLLKLIKGVGRLEAKVGTTGLHTSLKLLKKTAERCLRTDILRDVNEIPGVTPDARQVSRASRNPLYRESLRLLDRRSALEHFRPSKADAIVAMLRQNWLSPITDEDLFEMVVLAEVLNCIRDELDFREPITLGLLVPDRNEVASFKGEKGEVFVYFDQTSPLQFDSRSEYKRTLALYEGIGGREHRPDLTVAFRPNQTSTPVLVFIDAKASWSADYLRESIYKAFSYIYDFQSCLPLTATGPKVALIFPKAPKRLGPLTAETPVAILSHGSSSELGGLLKLSLGL